MSFIEPLESRIAPATITGKVLTYNDIDGDLVKITFTGETPVPADIVFATGNFADTGPQSILSLALTANGAGFTLKATPQQGHGDSHANITLISGPGFDLGIINVDGNVDAIDAGSGTAGKLGLKSFTALSMGRSFSPSSVDAVTSVGVFHVKGDVVNHSIDISGPAKSIIIGGNIEETISGSKSGLFITGGDVGSIKIGGSIIGRSSGAANLDVLQGNAGSVSIGGSIFGGSADITSEGDQIQFSGNVGIFTLSGSIVGGAGSDGGSLDILGHVTNLKVGGSVIGGSGLESGQISNTSGTAGALSAVTIGGDLDGRAGGEMGGTVTIGNPAKTIKIGGSILGGDQSETGLLLISANAGAVSIGHDISGGDSQGNDNVTSTGGIYSFGSIGSLTVGGDLTSGRVEGAGSLVQSGFISTQTTLGTVKVDGSILGTPGNRFYISAGGSEASAALITAIKSLSIKGSVQSASIVAGYSGLGTYQADDQGAGIGTVSIGGDMSGSFIIAGSNPGPDHIPGNSDDQADATTTTIGSIKIGGDLRGLEGDNTSYFIFAPIVKKLTVGKAVFDEAQLKPGVFFTATGTAIAQSVN